MKLTIKEKFMLGGVKETKNPKYVIYTLLDENFDKFTLVSDIKLDGIKAGTQVVAEIELTIKNERFDLKNADTPLFTDTVRFNLKSIQPAV